MKITMLILSFMMLGQVACSDMGSDYNTRPNTSSIPSAMVASQTKTIDVNGVSRIYHIVVPTNLNTDKPLPVIFSFHGFGSSGKKQESLTNMNEMAVEKGFIVVYPEGLTNRQGKQYWNTQQMQDIPADINFVNAVLGRLTKQYPNQTQKVFATGISNGGGMAHVLATQMADKVVAIAPVAGAYYDYNVITPSKPVAVMAFHGTKDRVVPYKGRRILPDINTWANFWANQNNCNSQIDMSVAARGVYEQRWQGCDAPTVLYTIQGKGHSWPGSNMPSAITTKQINASQEIVEFFSQFVD